MMFMEIVVLVDLTGNVLAAADIDFALEEHHNLLLCKKLCRHFLEIAVHFL